MELDWALFILVLMCAGIVWAEVDMEVTRWRSRE